MTVWRLGRLDLSDGHICRLRIPSAMSTGRPSPEGRPWFLRTGGRKVKANMPSDLSCRNEYLRFASLGCSLGIAPPFFQDWNVPARS